MRKNVLNRIQLTWNGGGLRWFWIACSFIYTSPLSLVLWYYCFPEELTETIGSLFPWYYIIVMCLAMTWGLKDKSQVDLHWVVLAKKEAPSLPHRHKSLTQLNQLVCWLDTRRSGKRERDRLPTRLGLYSPARLVRCLTSWTRELCDWCAIDVQRMPIRRVVLFH